MNESIEFDGVLLEVRSNDLGLLADQAWQLGALGLEERSASLVITFADDATATRAAAELAKLGAVERVHPSATSDWVSNWRSHARTTLEAGFVVHPPWLTPPAEGLDLVIDPGRTFGHGGHTTTRLMLRAVAHHVNVGTTMLDVGCGSGVLAIAAARLGASATAIDIDPDAVATTERNALANRVPVAVSATPLADIDTTFDLVLVNVTARTMAGLAADLCRVTHGRLMASGLLTGQMVPGLEDLTVVYEEDGWVLADLRFDRPIDPGDHP